MHTQVLFLYTPLCITSQSFHYGEAEPSVDHCPASGTSSQPNRGSWTPFPFSKLHLKPSQCYNCGFMFRYLPLYLCVVCRSVITQVSAVWMTWQQILDAPFPAQDWLSGLTKTFCWLNIRWKPKVERGRCIVDGTETRHNHFLSSSTSRKELVWNPVSVTVWYEWAVSFLLKPVYSGLSWLVR